MSFVTSWMGAPVLPLVALDPNSNAYPAGHHLGDPLGLSHLEPDLIADNIKAGITIFGVLGTFMYWDRYIQENIASSKSLSVIAGADQSISRNALMTAVSKYAYSDDPTDLIKLLTPALVTSKAITMIAAADQSVAKNTPITQKYDLIIVVSGAEAYVHTGSYTDETAAAQNVTANDMTLLPAVPAQNDAYYFGHDKVFDVMTLNIGTPGVGVWTITWEYWNGAWIALSGVVDGTNNFTVAAGSHDVTFTRPGDWATTAVNTVTKYWIRARVSAYTSVITQPKGTQASIKIIT